MMTVCVRQQTLCSKCMTELLLKCREEALQVTVRLLVPSGQIGCIIGKGGQIVQTIRSDTASQIRILKDNHVPAYALSNDELVRISGEPSNVRKALFQIATRLHDNPSCSQHLLSS
ncbi:putative K domain-containing protein [Helianthus anomalus]